VRQSLQTQRISFDEIGERKMTEHRSVSPVPGVAHNLTNGISRIQE